MLKIKLNLEIVDKWSTRIQTTKIFNDLCDLDLWPIDREMICDSLPLTGCVCAT